MTFEKYLLGSSCHFTKFIGKHLRCNRCFPVNFAKILRTLILWNICERLLLTFQAGKALYNPLSNSLSDWRW